MQGVTELGYVRFGVSDLAAWHDFAESLVGLEVLDEGESGRLYLRSDDWHHRIVLEQGVVGSVGVVVEFERGSGTEPGCQEARYESR